MLHSMLLLGSFAQGLYGAVLLLTGLFLICLILLQRGRGGGLAGAFGGMGGQSAFGSKAGDAFTHFTIVIAALWIVVCISGTFIGNDAAEPVFSSKGPASGGEVTGTGSDATPDGAPNGAAGDSATNPTTPGETSSSDTPMSSETGPNLNPAAPSGGENAGSATEKAGAAEPATTPTESTPK